MSSDMSDLSGSLELPRDSAAGVAAAAPTQPAFAGVAAQEQRGRTGSPLPWLAPLAKKIRRTASFGRLCGSPQA
jgi:hypothetical protein